MFSVMLVLCIYIFFLIKYISQLNTIEVAISYKVIKVQKKRMSQFDYP